MTIYERMSLLKTTRSHFDYKKTLRELEKLGKETFGPGFKLLQSDLPILIGLTGWMLRDTTVVELLELPLNKGLYFTGPTGAGKTALMLLMRHIKNNEHRHQLVQCREIAMEYAQKGNKVIEQYTKSKQAFCFDDLGEETPFRYYGVKCDVMKEIIVGRHALFKQHGIITHFTSRLNSSSIEARYGKEIRSRLREMISLLAFDYRVDDKRGRVLP